MRILCSTYEYPPIGGGGANVAHPLAATLVENGHSVDVVTSGMQGLPATETLDGVRIHRVPCVRRHRHYTTTAELMTYFWPAYRKARELHRQQPFDINHTHFALPSGLASYLLHRKTGLPYVITIHGSDVPGYNPDRFRLAHVFAQPLWKRVVGNCERVVAASEFLKRLFATYADAPVDIVHNGYAPHPARANQNEKQKRILVVTRMFERKGVQHFLAALEGLDHDWEVTVVGDGPYLPTLRESARRKKLNIHFPGFISGDELYGYYESAKIFVFPSLQENFPNVLLEAMEAGCAIITTSAHGCAEVIGYAGIAVKPERPDEIRGALSTLMNDSDKIAMLGRAAKKRIELFRWPRIASEYGRILVDASAVGDAEKESQVLRAGVPRGE